MIQPTAADPRHGSTAQTGDYWLAGIPTGWRLLPNRAVLAERIERSTHDEQMLSVTIDGGIMPQAELLEGASYKDSSNEDRSNYKLVHPGDLAYNKMRMWQGAVGMSSYRGIVSPAYIVLKPRADINPRYYHYLFRTPGYTTESYRNSYGICDDMLSLRYEDFKTMLSPVPPAPIRTSSWRSLTASWSRSTATSPPSAA